ncbi:MAG: glycoside hydrolase family 65 [Eubacteriales bacterium]|nr:glycoside hydrolase family 65 [Eubacteriales bacterium]
MKNINNNNINREEIVKKYNPHLSSVNAKSPLSVGNGRICFTADITGMQTLYDDYLDETPLCTMAEWAWHVIKADNERGCYSLDDVKMTEYDYMGRRVSYPRVKYEGNEDAYDWVRQNPHKFNLGRITFMFKGEPVNGNDLDCINQTLDISTGLLHSTFRFKQYGDEGFVNVVTVCDSESDTVAFKINSQLLTKGLSVEIHFPYPSCDITGSDWTDVLGHSDRICYENCKDGNKCTIERIADETTYYVNISSDSRVEKLREHAYGVSSGENLLHLSVNFQSKKMIGENFENASKNSRAFWHNYWNSGKFFIHDNNELMRRVILSQYLLVINDSGFIPPGETGLTCNSWYGKAHLEMHYWHMAWAPLWGHPELLERSFDWYINILPEARKNAARNGYKGARWTKMVSYTGKDCPSKIAPLLVWQQPHIINMLQMVLDSYKENGISTEDVDTYMRKYWILVKETAEFMEDYLVYDFMSDTYNIESPVIPVQERHLPEDTRNPIFELAYFRYGLVIASQWASHLGDITLSQKWDNIAGRIAPLPVSDGLYISHENCPETFTEKAIDHPLMLMVYGMLDGFGAKDIIDMDVYKSTLLKVIDVWDYPTLWGWDFAVIAMAADKLGLKDTAVSQLLMDSPKNEYVESGNNRQNSRKDLPLYLPGNGSLLIAVAKGSDPGKFL